MTQSQLAHAVGRTKGAVCHYEKDEVVPPDDVKLRLAEALHVDPSWLTFGEDQPGLTLAYAKLTGEVRQGGRIVPTDSRELVAVPPGLSGDKVLAYRVADGSLTPHVAAGDLIYAPSLPQEDVESLLGQLAVVELRTGVKPLRLVEPSLMADSVTLTAPNAVALADVMPVGLYPVLAIIKAVAGRYGARLSG